MKNGYGAPRVKIYDYQGLLLDELAISRFHYSYCGDSGDYCEIAIKDIDAPRLFDNPSLQHMRPITVTWGYLGSNQWSRRRTVYILDTEEKSDESGAVLVLKCYPKAVFLKFNQSQNIRTNVSTNGLGKELADKHNLSYEDPEKALEEDNLFIEQYNGRKQGFYSESGLWSASRDNTSAIQGEYINPILAQGNKSDWKHIKETAEKDPSGPLDVIGRDNKLIIKKRNFAQQPIRTWNYQNEDGFLKSFTYSSNNKSKMQAATNVQVSGWDVKSKSYIEGNANSLADKNARLGDEEFGSPRSVQTSSNSIKANPQGSTPVNGNSQNYNNGGGKNLSTGKQAEPYEVIDEYNGLYALNTENGVKYVEGNSENGAFFKDQGNWTAPTDNTAVYRDDIYIDYNKRAMSKEQSADGITGEGVTTRAKSAMQNNNANAVSVGIPFIESGKIGTFTNLGSKNSGNWFILKATHTIDENSAYLLTMELTRNAQGKSNVSGPTVNVNKNVKNTNSTWTSQSYPSSTNIAIPKTNQ